MKRRLRKHFPSFSFFILSLLLVSLTFEQAFGSTIRLSPITGGDLRAPSKIALDGEGNIYVASQSENRIFIYSRNGAYVNDIRGLNKPSCIGVDGSGRIYIGSDKGSVSVYNADLSFSHKLGSGEGEFIKPSSIAIDSAGDIYVADGNGNEVKVYGSGGELKFAFGSSGNGNGQFNFPTSIVIDDTKGEALVSDLQVTNTSNGPTAGARIQVFDKSGAFKRSFGTYGIGAGKIARPMGLSVDSSGNIYVSDSYQNVVHTFDSTGNSIGTLYDLNNPMSTPTGIVVGKDNRVFIASLNGSRVEVYGLSDYTTMYVTPGSLSFVAEEGGSNPPAKSISISNGGAGILRWSVISDKSWIVPAERSGSTGPSSSSQPSIGIDTTGLKEGTYTGNLTIIAYTGAIDIITVTLKITPPPIVLNVSPSSLSFLAQQNGKIPSSQSISITNTGGGTMNWSASADQAWISLNPASGTGNSIVSVTVNTASINVGDYKGNITVTSPNATGSPAIVSVDLNVISAGTINVATNLSSSTFTITGPSTYSGSGINYTIEDAPSGDYTITYGEAAGYKKPRSEKKTLASGSSITFNGNYIDLMALAEKRVIVTGQGPGSKNTALVKLWYRNGQAFSQFMASDLLYGVNIAAGDVNGDGIDDIIAGSGPGSKSPSLLRVFGRNGSLIAELNPFGYLYGLNVASGDIDGDGKAEIVVGAGPDSKNPAQVRVFSLDTLTGSLVDTGINFTAYSYTYGVKVAVGDIDGDGIKEIITAPGPGPKNPALIKIWKVDTSGGIGHWKVTLNNTITAFDTKYGANIATGDVDGDDIAEIIVGIGPDPDGASRVKVLKPDGTIYSDFTVDATLYGVNVASDDLDGDGLADVITGSGSGSENKAAVKLFKGTGEPLRDASGTAVTFDAYSTKYGVNISVGKILE